jgi:hypothetical protein
MAKEPAGQQAAEGNAATADDTRFGAYGGRFVPETLVAALDELAAAYAEASRDPAYRAELDALLRDFVGRPTPPSPPPPPPPPRHSTSPAGWARLRAASRST